MNIAVISSILGSSGGGDSVAPSVVITTNVLNLADSTFTATFTFSEAVTGFVAGDVTVVNCTVGALSTSDNIVFTSTITNTSTDDSDLTLRVPASCCTDAAGNANTISNLITLSVEPYMYRYFGANLQFGIEPAYLQNMLQESTLDATTPVGATPVAATNDSCGTIYDISANAHQIFAPNNSRRPTLVSKVGSDAWLNFDPTTLSQYLTIVNTTHFFRQICKASPLWTFTFEIDLSTLTDGTAYTIFDTTTNTSAQAGLYITRTTGNKIQVVVFKAVGGQNVVNFTSTFTANAAAGITQVCLVMNGTGANAFSAYFNSAAAETATVNAGVDNLILTYDMRIGTLANAGTNGLKAALRKIYWITGVAADSTQRSVIRAYNPQRNTKNIVRVFRKTDPNQIAYSYKDTGLSSPVTSDGDRVRMLLDAGHSNLVSGAKLLRDWNAPVFYIDLSGSSTAGHACTVTIDGVVLTATYATSLYQTSVNFRTNGTNATNLLTLKMFVVEQSNQSGTQLGRINFYMMYPGAAEPSVVTINTTVGTLTGTKYDTKRAYQKQNVVNSKGLLEFQFADWNGYRMLESTIEAGGRKTKFFVLKYLPLAAPSGNGDTGVGHFGTVDITGTGRYLFSGKNYSGNSSILSGAPVGHGYPVIHDSGDTHGEAVLKEEVLNLYTIRQTGLLREWWLNGVFINSKTLAAGSVDKILYRGVAQVGDQTATGANSRNVWEGLMGETYELQGYVPDAVVESENDRLMTTYSITA